MNKLGLTAVDCQSSQTSVTLNCTPRYSVLEINILILLLL